MRTITALFVGLGSIGTRHLKNLTNLCADRGWTLQADALRSDLSRPLRDGVAALLQRLRPLPRGGLQAPPARLLRGPRSAAVRGLGARLVQARDRRRRARRRGEAGGHQGLPAPGAVARADGGAQRRAGGPVALDHLPLGLGGLRRHDEHGAQAEGRLQAEEARRRAVGHAPLSPQVARRVPRPRGGRVRRGLGYVRLPSWLSPVLGCKQPCLGFLPQP